MEQASYKFKDQGSLHHTTVMIISILRRKVMLGSILWAVVVILFVLWLLGFLFHVAGGLIHILLVIAVLVLLYNLFFGSRAGRL
jgi:ABC-type multidrug transport system permease subunit